MAINLEDLKNKIFNAQQAAQHDIDLQDLKAQILIAQQRAQATPYRSTPPPFPSGLGTAVNPMPSYPTQTYDRDGPYDARYRWHVAEKLALMITEQWFSQRPTPFVHALEGIEEGAAENIAKSAVAIANALMKELSK
jgi:hypothetical protein